MMRSAHRNIRCLQAGLTLVELMVAMTISLMVLLALVSVYVNLARANDEMAKSSSLIDNGRSALQLLQNDLVHAGYWAGFVPQFDDLTFEHVPADVPTSIPDVCLDPASWTGAYKTNLIAVPVQTSDVLPSGTGCISFPAQRAGTDVIMIRHLETCVPGGLNCDTDTAGRLYMQTSMCAAEKNAGTVIGATSNSIVLDSHASTNNGAYTGVTLRIVSGTGMGQLRNVTTYVGSSRTATFDSPWTVIPDTTSVYAFEYALGSSAFPLHRRDCVGTGTPASLPITGGTLADKRRLISNIYYIADLPHPDGGGRTVPTLMRSQLDLSGGALVQRAPVRLLDGVEALRVELGIDNTGKTGAAVNYAEAVHWEDVSTKMRPTNRGDGSPDVFKRCTTADPCTADELMNVVAVKLYVLARSRDASQGYTDSKVYCLGEPDVDGSCPAANTIAAANDNFKRHVFTTSMRLTNISGRRETPEP
ncbi:PilW family protein [Steroidobacter flavus]|uniref:PilW family protein n=1 Tax=Steroidobacter flavus TaxID=1842136 RepID=A0ABV8SKZ1_9GAMM